MFNPEPIFLGIDESFPERLRGGAVSIGNFDGVHRGHVALVKEVSRKAQRYGGPAVIVTFDPHPLRLLAPDRFMPQLTTVRDRTNLLVGAGAWSVVVLKTTRELLMMEPQSFLQRLLMEQLGAKAIVEGFNFQFGRDRRGNTEMLKHWCDERKIRSTIVSAELAKDGQPYSSSRVRLALDTGDLSAVREMLDRNYWITGIVGTGEKRGRTLGFPTANLEEIPVHIPADGVYAAKVFLGHGFFPAAVNIGPNPTFGENQRKVEIHVIGFDGDLYGKEMQVEFVQRLRDTWRFASKDELIAQLHLDVSNARQTIKVQSQSLPHESDNLVGWALPTESSGSLISEDNRAVAFMVGSAHPTNQTQRTPIDLKSRIQQHLDTNIAPAFAVESTTFEVIDIIDGVIRMRFNGACASCPSTIMTLIMGIEQELQKHFPEIEYLEAVP